MLDRFVVIMSVRLIPERRSPYNQKLAPAQIGKIEAKRRQHHRPLIIGLSDDNLAGSTRIPLHGGSIELAVLDRIRQRDGPEGRKRLHVDVDSGAAEQGSGCSTNLLPELRCRHALCLSLPRHDQTRCLGGRGLQDLLGDQNRTHLKYSNEKCDKRNRDDTKFHRGSAPRRSGKSSEQQSRTAHHVTKVVSNAHIAACDSLSNEPTPL